MKTRKNKGFLLLKTKYTLTDLNVLELDGKEKILSSTCYISNDSGAFLGLLYSGYFNKEAKISYIQDSDVCGRTSGSSVGRAPLLVFRFTQGLLVISKEFIIA